MIAKITKGSCFRGVVNYILDKEKDAKIFVCDGLFAEDKDTIAMSFEAQCVGIPEGNGDNRHAGSHRAPLRQGASARAYSVQLNRQ